MASDFGSAIVSRLERRGISVSMLERLDIDKRAKDTRGLLAMLGAIDEAKTARQMIKAR